MRTQDPAAHFVTNIRTDGLTHARTYKYTRSIAYTRHAIARALKTANVSGKAFQLHITW
jgi:hypothetical protein